MNLLAVVLAAAGPWFEADVAGSSRWPSGTDPVAEFGTGTWMGREFVVGTGRTIAYEEAYGTGFAFAPSVRRDASEGEVTVRSVMTFTDRRRLSPTDGAKAAVTAFGGSYYGVATNTWVRLEGEVPEFGAPTEVEITLKRTNGVLTARYAVNGTTLTAGGEEWLRSAATDAEVALFAFQGTGSVSALHGETYGVANCELSIPETIDGMSVSAVRVGGTEVAPVSERVYEIPTNAIVEVCFAADEGLALSVSSMRFTMTGSMTLPDAGRPTAIDPRVIAVSEFMAAPTNGYDWVEIRNATNVDVDVSGWLITDDCTKKLSKWKAIEGAAVVPANGYLVVSVDGDVAQWPAGVAHAKLGLSDEGEMLGLATPDGGTTVSRIEFGQQFDEVSCGFAPDAEGLVYFRDPTPGAANVTKAYAPPTPAVTMSVAHGWKTEPFELTMSVADGTEAEIRYTLDGTAPTTESRRYEGPVRVERTSVVRAGVPVADTVLQRDTSATYLFVDDVVAQATMDTRITEGADRERVRTGFTNGVPSVSIVIDPKFLFDQDIGIYVNALREWERFALVEQIDPVRGAANEWAAPAGLSIRGGSSRNPDHPKHSFRLAFRRDYGMNKLKFPLFGEEGAKSFKKIDLRTSQNYAWSMGIRNDNFVYEAVSRDFQGAVGDPYTRSRSCHLFVNGVYWGLYQTDERIDDHFAESYNGGDKEEYDVVRTFHDERLTFETGVVEGDDAAWRALWKLADSGFSGANYPKACGLTADYVRDPSLPVLLNPTNLMHYMTIVHWTANTDTPSYGPAPNNVAAFRNRIDGSGGRDGFQFVLHDCEHALGFGNGKYDGDTTKYGTTEFSGNNNGSYANFAPAHLHYRLCQNEEYRMAFADQVYRHVLKKGGALTVPEALRRFRTRMEEVDDAISCEAARWGAACATIPDHAQWLTNCQISVDFIEKRTPYFLKAYRDRRWYPSPDAPVLTKGGRELSDGDGVPPGAKLALTVPADCAVYYTLDGSDPRLRGGALNEKAVAYDVSEGIVLRGRGSVRVMARARTAKGEWSALEDVRLKLRSGLMLIIK